MSYLLFLVPFAISLLGLIFKTTEEDRTTGKKKLNRWGVSVLFLMVLGVAFNIYVKHNDAVTASLKDRRLKDEKTVDSLRMASMADSTVASLKASQRNLVISEKEVGILNDNVLLQKQNRSLTDNFNKYLKRELTDTKLELSRIKSPVDSLLMTTEIVFKLDSDLNKKIYAALVKNKIDILYETILSYDQIQKIFPEIKTDLDKILITTDYYQSKDLDPITTLNNVYIFANNNLKSLPLERFNFEYKNSTKSLLMSIREFKASFMLNNTNFQSFKEFCNSIMRIDIETEASARLHFLPNSLYIKTLYFTPTKNEKSTKSFSFSPVDKDIVKNQHSLISYILTKCDCNF